MKIGFGRIDITPPLGTKITGAWQLRDADGIMDPLYLNAVAMEVEEQTLVIITADLLSMNERNASQIRGIIAKEFDLPVENILTQCLHQHTATTGGSIPMVGATYHEIMKRKYCDVVRLALNDLSEASVSCAEKETAEPVSFIRRFRMKDGSVMTNPGTMNPEIDHPLGDADNTVRLVRFTRDGKKDIAMVGFQTHPDTIGGNQFSADWPGFVRATVEERLPNTHCILLNGCQGDTNHHKVGRPQIKKAMQAERYEFTRRMGQIIAEAAIDVWDQTATLPLGKVTCKWEIKTIRSNMEGIEEIEACKALHKRIAAADPEVMKLPMSEKGRIRRIAHMDDLLLFQKVPVSMVAVGNFVIVGYGGEPFTEYATVLRKAYPQLFILTCCNCNGSQGYLPSEAAFSEGGYEACTTSFTPETPSIMQGAALELIRSHVENA